MCVTPLMKLSGPCLLQKGTDEGREGQMLSEYFVI